MGRPPRGEPSDAARRGAPRRGAVPTPQPPSRSSSVRRVLPGLALGHRVAQQVGGVEHRQGGQAQRLGLAAAQLGDAAHPQERGAGRVAHGDEDLGGGERDVALQEGLHHGDLADLGVAVLRRAPGHDVGDVDRARGVLGAARQADGGEHQVEQLARAADEGQALDVLVAPRRLAHDHHPCPGHPIGEDDVARAAAELAMGIGGDRGPERGEVRGGRGRGSRGLDGVVGERRRLGAVGGDSLAGRIRGGRGEAVHGLVAHGVGGAHLELPLQHRACQRRIELPAHRPRVGRSARGIHLRKAHEALLSAGRMPRVPRGGGDCRDPRDRRRRPARRTRWPDGGAASFDEFGRRSAAPPGVLTAAECGRQPRTAGGSGHGARGAGGPRGPARRVRRLARPGRS